MPSSAQDIIYVQNSIPFSHAINFWLRLNNLTFHDWVKSSRHHEAAYVAWEVVRKNRNPFFVTGTGFEGYYIGVCASPEEALSNIIGMSQGILNSIRLSYRQEYNFKSRLMKTLTGEIADMKMMQIWAAQFGMAIGQLRCNLQHNRAGDLFRIETYRSVQTLPPISYEQQGDDIQQTFSVGLRDKHPKIQIDMHEVKPSEQDAWLVAWSIGQFGHPLVRTYLKKIYRAVPDWL